MRISAFTAVLATIVLAAGCAHQSEPLAARTSLTVLADQSQLRVGVYDNRGILMAWFASKYNDVTAQQREYAQAKQAGDDERMKQVVKFQQRLHFMGFGRAPVSELLKPIEDQLPTLAKKLGVDVIAFECNYSGDNVEIVDITLDLVMLYDPSPETIKSVKDVMKHDPVALEELAGDDH